MTTYSIDVRIYGTLRVDAENPEAAMMAFREHMSESVEIGAPVKLYSGIDKLSGVELSPAMVLHCIEDGDTPSAE